MRAARLAEIKEAIETLDTGKYHGADMLAVALIEMAGQVRELIEELEEIREQNPILIGDRVKLPVEDEGDPEEGVVVSFADGGDFLVSVEGWERPLYYTNGTVERIEE